MKQQAFAKNRFFSLHFKLPLIFGLLFFTAFQMVAFLFNRQLQSQSMETFQAQMISQSTLVAKSALTIFETDKASSMTLETNELVKTAAGGDVQTIHIYDMNGNLTAATTTDSEAYLGSKVTDDKVLAVLANPVSTNYEFGEVGNRSLRVITPIVSEQGKVYGVVVLDAEIETVYTQLKNISNLFFSTMIIVLIVTVAVSVFVANFIIARPISKIEDKMERIALGEYDAVDVEVSSRDELGILAKSINDLSIRIKETKDLTESERQRLDSVLKHMSDGVIATDRRGNIVIVNEAALRLLDRNRDQVLNASVMDVFRLRNKYTYRQLLETQDELILSVTSESGEESIVRGEFSVIRRESGFISGIVCVLSDITEQEKIDRERREFVSNVSHELRTPLTSMRSYTESLLDGAWQDPELAPMFLEVIQSENERMIRMVNDLLELSKMDSEVKNLQFEIVEVNQLLTRILDRFDMLLTSEEYAHKSYRIVRELAEKTLWVEADQDSLIQVIYNILNNAIKYSPDGGHIICRLVESGSNVVISVTDQGLGIPRQSIPYIFKRFYRVDKARSRAQGGTGLGLSISKEVIERHKGKIWVNSIENQGSTFFVSLPKIDYVDDDEWA